MSTDATMTDAAMIDATTTEATKADSTRKGGASGPVPAARCLRTAPDTRVARAACGLLVAIGLGLAASGPASAQSPAAAGDRMAPAEIPPDGPVGGTPIDRGGVRAPTEGGEGAVRPAPPPSGTGPQREAAEERLALESVLSTARTRDDYARLLQQTGFTITSVDSDVPGRLAYAVAKGDRRYAVRLAFEGGAATATRIEVVQTSGQARSS